MDTVSMGLQSILNSVSQSIGIGPDVGDTSKMTPPQVEEKGAMEHNENNRDIETAPQARSSPSNYVSRKPSAHPSVPCAMSESEMRVDDRNGCSRTCQSIKPQCNSKKIEHSFMKLFMGNSVQRPTRSSSERRSNGTATSWNQNSELTEVHFGGRSKDDRHAQPSLDLEILGAINCCESMTLDSKRNPRDDIEAWDSQEVKGTKSSMSFDSSIDQAIKGTADPSSVSKPKCRKSYKKPKHLRWFGHGKVCTIFSLVVSWMAVICSVLACRSLEFVYLRNPLDFGPMYHPTHSIGAIRMKLCYDFSLASIEGCEILYLNSEAVNDKMVQWSRVLLLLGSLFGTFFTIMLTTSIYWESINLRPIGFGFLLSYFMQSFSMLFFDSQLCRASKCRVGPGSALAIVACFGWLSTCVATARMEAYKIRAQRLRRRELRRKRREERKRKLLMMRQLSDSTAKTVSTTYSI